MSTLTQEEYPRSPVLEDLGTLPGNRRQRHVEIWEELKGLNAATDKLELLLAEICGEDIPEREPANKTEPIPTIQEVLQTTGSRLSDTTDRINDLVNALHNALY